MQNFDLCCLLLTASTIYFSLFVVILVSLSGSSLFHFSDRALSQYADAMLATSLRTKSIRMVIYLPATASQPHRCLKLYKIMQN